VGQARQAGRGERQAGEQLRAAEQSLELARESLRRLPNAADLDSSEVLLLQRLLAGDTVGWEATRSLRA